MRFKIGDRVAVYGEDFSPFRGRVSGLNGERVFVVEDGFYSCHKSGSFHPKQCRKLVKVKDKTLKLLWQTGQFSSFESLLEFYNQFLKKKD